MTCRIGSHSHAGESVAWRASETLPVRPVLRVADAGLRDDGEWVEGVVLGSPCGQRAA